MPVPWLWWCHIPFNVVWFVMPVYMKMLQHKFPSNRLLLNPELTEALMLAKRCLLVWTANKHVKWDSLSHPDNITPTFNHWWIDNLSESHETLSCRNQDNTRNCRNKNFLFAILLVRLKNTITIVISPLSLVAVYRVSDTWCVEVSSWIIF